MYIVLTESEEPTDFNYGQDSPSKTSNKSYFSGQNSPTTSFKNPQFCGQNSPTNFKNYHFSGRNSPIDCKIPHFQGQPGRLSPKNNHELGQGSPASKLSPRSINRGQLNLKAQKGLEQTLPEIPIIRTTKQDDKSQSTGKLNHSLNISELEISFHQERQLHKGNIQKTLNVSKDTIENSSLLDETKKFK